MCKTVFCVQLRSYTRFSGGDKEDDQAVVYVWSAERGVESLPVNAKYVKEAVYHRDSRGPSFGNEVVCWSQKHKDASYCFLGTRYPKSEKYPFINDPSWWEFVPRLVEVWQVP